MKNLFSVLASAFFALVFLSCQEDKKGINKDISFYEVPLVCGAAPKIGCGSRAKPALLQLEKNSAVKEAWLNRPGTVIAIVWKDSVQTKSIAKPIFESNEIPYNELDEKKSAQYSSNFRKPNLWFRGGDVDVLSREEAETIAESSVKLALSQNLITSGEAEKLKADITAYFKNELVKIRTNEQLNEDSEHKFREDLMKIGEKHIGRERAEKALALYEESCKEQCRKDKACSAPGTKKCCDND